MKNMKNTRTMKATTLIGLCGLAAVLVFGSVFVGCNDIDFGFEENGGRGGGQAPYEPYVPYVPNGGNGSATAEWHGDWIGTGENTYTSNPIGHSQSTVETLTITTDAPYELTIELTASSEGGYDFGSASLLDSNDTTAIRVSGAETKTHTYTVPAGTHRIYFTYRKDISDTAGDDNVTVRITSGGISGGINGTLPGGLAYQSNEQGGVTITGYTDTAGDLVIPAEIAGLRVTAIGDRAFEGCDGLTSVTIPDSVETIGDEAFRGCSSLESVTIPGSVETIGNSAFLGCRSLESVTILGSVTSIGYTAFYLCDGLTSVTFEGSISPENFSDGYDTFPGDLRAAYFAGGAGTYTRPSGSETWTKE
jgi:hypothetical protein